MCDSLCCVTFQFSTLLYVLCDSLCCVNFRCSVFLFVLNDSLCCLNFQCSVFLYASSSLSALDAEIHSAGTLLTVGGGSKEAVGHASPLRCLAPTGLPVTCSTIFTDDVTLSEFLPSAVLAPEWKCLNCQSAAALNDLVGGKIHRCRPRAC